MGQPNGLAPWRRFETATWTTFWKLAGGIAVGAAVILGRQAVTRRARRLTGARSE